MLNGFSRNRTHLIFAIVNLFTGCWFEGEKVKLVAIDSLMVHSNLERNWSSLYIVHEKMRVDPSTLPSFHSKWKFIDDVNQQSDNGIYLKPNDSDPNSGLLFRSKGWCSNREVSFYEITFLKINQSKHDSLPARAYTLKITRSGIEFFDHTEQKYSVAEGQNYIINVQSLLNDFCLPMAVTEHPDYFSYCSNYIQYYDGYGDFFSSNELASGLWLVNSWIVSNIDKFDFKERNSYNQRVSILMPISKTLEKISEIYDLQNPNQFIPQ